MLLNRLETGRFSTYIILDSHCPEQVEIKSKNIHFTCNYAIKYVGKGV